MHTDAGIQNQPESLNRAVAGDERAFTDLITPLAGPAMRLALAILQDRAAAEDAVQDAVLRAWQNLGRLKPPYEVRPWFLAIVRNRCRDVLRMPWSRVSLALHADTPVAARENSTDTAMDVARALAGLSRDDRAALLLRFHLDLPMAEVGRVLGVTEGAARVRVHRALARIRPGLEIPEELQ